MQALGSLGFQIYDKSAPTGHNDFLTTEPINCISVSIQIDMQLRGDVRGRERRRARTREPEELTKMMHGQKRHETEDRDHGWNRE